MSENVHETNGDAPTPPELIWEQLEMEMALNEETASSPSNTWTAVKILVLDNIEPIDFAAEAELSDGETITQKVATVVVVRVLFRLLLQLNLGLCLSGGQLLCYLGNYWKQIERQELPTFLGTTAASMGVPTIQAEHHFFRDGLVKQLYATVPIHTADQPGDRTLINLKSQTLVFSGNNRYVREFRREDFLMYRLPFDYDPDAVCPGWNNFLDRVLPDVSSQAVLAEMFATPFLDLKLEKVMLLYGTGANGKSVVFDVMDALFGPENITNYSLKNLSHPYFRARIANKLINFSSELSSGIDPDDFKKLASGEPIDARNIYAPPFIVRKYAKLVFNCNELPREVEHTKAFFRRMSIIPFNVTIPENEQNPSLAQEIISAELPGIFNWVLQGLDRLIANRRFSDCKAAIEQVKSYQLESDSVAMFLADEQYEPAFASQFTIPLKEIHREYRTYCNDNLYRPVSSTTLRRRLTALGYVSERKNYGMTIYAIRKDAELDEKILF